MADNKPENTNGRGGPEGRGPEGGRRDGRGGRHRGFRPRHGGRDGASAGGQRQGSGEAPQGERASRPQSRPEASRETARQEAARQDSAQQEAARQDAMRNAPLCPLCGKPVYDLSTALAASREAPEPAHFDCVLDRVTASETLAAGEKLVYLGSGAFGVVSFKDKGESSFTVLRRIQWEKEGEKKDWRKTLSSRITSI